MLNRQCEGQWYCASTQAKGIRSAAMGLLTCLALSLLLLGCVPASAPLRLALFPAAYLPPPSPPSDPRVQVEWLDTPEGAIETWFIPAPGASAENPGPAVLLLHGNFMLIEDLWSDFEPYRQRGLSLFFVEYRGYGNSTGSSNERTLAADLPRAFDLLADRPEVARDRIVVHGFSLGGAAAGVLLRSRQPSLVILQSTFSSFEELAGEFGASGPVIEDTFDTEGALLNYGGQVLILHGREDELIPFAHAERLAAACPQANLVELSCGHNDCIYDTESYWQAIDAALAPLLNP